MKWDKVKQSRSSMPEPPPAEGNTMRLDRPVARPDGRTLRATGRTKQFNPRVRPEFMDRFARAQAKEEERAGEKITQGYFLELLLVDYERAQGAEVHPFGLSDAAYRAAQAIAEHNGWPLSAVLEDALLARAKHFNLLTEPEGKKK